MRQEKTRSELEQNHFIPPFCPNPECEFHQPSEKWRYKLSSWYWRDATAEWIRRFKCLHCGRSFSRSTFSVSYWLHKPELLPVIAGLSVSCVCLRQMARQLGISHNTVGRYLDRIGRHCLLHHQRLLAEFEIPESIAVDGFESFEYSQYFPFHFHLATGRDSWFIYHFTDSPLRRKGRMTKEQKERRNELEAQLGRPDPKAIEKDMMELLETVVSKMHRRASAEIHSDEHPAYPRSIRRLHRSRPELPSIDHRTILSTEARTTRNPLFTINRVDLLIRHCGANHKRETIAFSKQRQRAAHRMAALLVYLNEIKWQRENGPPRSVAMILGLRKSLLNWKELLAERLFPTHVRLRGRWKDYYRGQVKTSIFGSRQVPHQLKYAI
jgi:hypothetical protein